MTDLIVEASRKYYVRQTTKDGNVIEEVKTGKEIGKIIRNDLVKRSLFGLEVYSDACKKEMIPTTCFLRMAGTAIK